MNYQPDKTLSLKTLIRDFSAHLKDDAGHDTGRLKSLYPDSELVKIAQTRLGKQYTDDAVRKARQRQGIEPCATWGGVRSGSGRPQGSENKSKSPAPPVRLRHKLSISTSAVVQACLSAYTCCREHVTDTFDYCNNRYTKPETWIYTGAAVRPHDLPAHYIPAPVATGSCGHKRFRLSQPDLQKLEAVK
jgi:hypothetical protein